MNKKYLTIALALAVCIAAIIGITQFISKDTTETLITQNKVIGSTFSDAEMHFDGPIYKNIDEMMASKYINLVVIGTVVSEAQTLEEDSPMSIPGAEKIKLHRSLSKIQVDEVLYGNETSKIITFAQMGKANNDAGETKVKNGERLLLVLNKNQYGYSAIGLEQGIARITQDLRTVLFSDNESLSSAYDNKSLNIIKKDIKDSITKIKK